jgi:hypothetical protein
MLLDRGFDARMEVAPDGCGKSWDIVIFQNGAPDVLIDVDGEFYHEYLSDSYTIRQTSYELDNLRPQRVPSGVRILLVDSRKVHEAMKSIMELSQMGFDEWAERMFNECNGSPFPYMTYSESRLRDDWRRLGTVNNYTKHFNTANSIMVHFHRSVYKARVGAGPSPMQAWNDPNLLKKCIKNRFIYKDSGNLSSYHVARGFEASKIAPRVTMFKPVYARYLLQAFAPDAQSVVDPFSGYSGRMLGAASLGMTYDGYDIESDTVAESMEIIAFLGLQKTSVSLVPPGTYPEGSYDVLLTCPPYGQKEVWGDGRTYKSSVDYVAECLEQVNADTYIFVVDEMWHGECTEEIVKNDALFGKAKEYVLVFDNSKNLIKNKKRDITFKSKLRKNQPTSGSPTTVS